MRSKLKKSKSEGFTIIEIMIVLVIAGLILLIVFLAVPALERSSRNTQRKNDIGQIASGINTFITDNNGTLPTSVAIAAGGQTTISSSVTGTVSVTDVKVGYYPAQTITVQAYAAAEDFAFVPPAANNFLGLLGSASATAPPPPPPPAATIGPDSFAITTGASCTGGTLGTGKTGVAAAGSRNVALTYELEQSGSSATAGGVDQCQDI
jgi:prepilin-type N-terminal cleavage/methylation domain-containing protein